MFYRCNTSVYWILISPTFTNDHGYVQFVVLIIGPFSIHDISQGSQQESYDGWHMRRRSFLPFWSIGVHPRSYRGFFGFCLMFCRPLFVLLSFVCWPLYFLSFFELPILITHCYHQTFLITKWTVIDLQTKKLWGTFSA